VRGARQRAGRPALTDRARRPALEQLLRALPAKQTRQTVLFSATYPSDIRNLCSFALRPGYEVVDTVGEEDTHAAETARPAPRPGRGGP